MANKYRFISFIKKNSARIKRRAENELLSSIDYVRISEIAAEDIFLIGYPRSGSTLLQNILVGLVFGLGPQCTPDSIIQDLIPDIYKKLYYRRYMTPMYFKSHNLPDPKYKKVIYLVRDGRDALVSYYHYLKIVKGAADMMDMINDRDLFPSQWHKHVSAWTLNPFCAEILVIRYEDMLLNPLIQLNRICGFTGIERGQSLLKDISNSTTFPKMREKENRFGWDQLRIPVKVATHSGGKLPLSLLS